MLQNLLQDILFLLFLAAGFFVLLKNRKARYGLIVRDDADKLIRDGTQGLETTFGRSRGSDVRINDPTVSRRQAVLKYDPKADLIVAWSKSGRVAATDAIPNHRFRFSLPLAGGISYCSLITLCAAGFVGLRMIAVYGELREVRALIPFCILFAYLFLSAALRADHTPVVEAILSILLTYHIDATLYTGTVTDATLGVSIYTACAFLTFLFLSLDLGRIHSLLRFLASAGILVLILLNLALATQVNGAYNWIEIGGFTFQPSELVKLLLAFVLVVPARKPASGFANFLFSVAVPAVCFVYALLIKDVGCLLQFGVLYLTAVIIQGDNLLFSICLLLTTILGCKGVLALSSTAASRLLGWRGSAETSLLSALTATGIFEDPYGYGFQSTRSLIAAFKNGGLFGNGGYDALAGVLAANSDLVTAMLAQKHGWLLLFLLPALYTLLILYVLHAMRQKTKLQQAFTILSITLIVFAMLLNMGGTLGVIALTGVVNPALSDGMSAAVSYGAFFGVLASSGLTHKYIKKTKGDPCNDTNNQSL